MNVDLHCHSSASDGALQPPALIDRAAAAGVDLLAITDHDTLDAYPILQSDARTGPRLVPGIEFSTRWMAAGIHVLGLNVDPADPHLAAGAAFQQEARRVRAALIARRLEKMGVPDCLAAVSRIADGRQIGRPHFARHLVAAGFARTEQQAFRRFLGRGKPGDVTAEWADMATVIGWIRASGGVAILAHPAKYGLTWTKLNRLLDDFVASGGRGIEVISGQQTSELTRRLARISIDRQLFASAGSDYHGPAQPWLSLGHVPPLPDGCAAVWEYW